MTRRHPLPAEVYALVEQTPATVLLEGGKPGQTNEQPWTQLFTAPVRACVAWQVSEIPALFAEIESAVAAGLSAAGFFSYECGNYFEPKAAMRPSREGQPLAWFGIYERSYTFDHEAGAFLDGEPPELRSGGAVENSPGWSPRERTGTLGTRGRTRLRPGGPAEIPAGFSSEEQLKGAEPAAEADGRPALRRAGQPHHRASRPDALRAAQPGDAGDGRRAGAGRAAAAQHQFRPAAPDGSGAGAIRYERAVADGGGGAGGGGYRAATG